MPNSVAETAPTAHSLDRCCLLPVWLLWRLPRDVAGHHDRPGCQGVAGACRSKACYALRMCYAAAKSSANHIEGLTERRECAQLADTPSAASSFWLKPVVRCGAVVHQWVEANLTSGGGFIVWAQKTFGGDDVAILNNSLGCNCLARSTVGQHESVQIC